MLLATGYEPTTTFDSKGPLGFETNKQTFYKLPKSSSFEDRIDAASILFRAHLNKRSFVAIGYGRGGGESLARGQASHNASISFTPPRFGLKSNYTRIIPRPPPLIIYWNRAAVFYDRSFLGKSTQRRRSLKSFAVSFNDSPLLRSP